MTEYYYDSWNDADECHPTERELYALEDEIRELKEEIKLREEDELFTLTEIMIIRDKALRGDPVDYVIEALNGLINVHNPAIKERAIKNLLKLSERL
jgi:hypothetical protein